MTGSLSDWYWRCVCSYPRHRRSLDVCPCRCGFHFVSWMLLNLLKGQGDWGQDVLCQQSESFQLSPLHVRSREPCCGGPGR